LQLSKPQKIDKWSDYW